MTSSAAEAAFYSYPLVGVFAEATEKYRGPRLEYFDAGCDEDDRHECHVAALTCPDRATVGIDLDSVPSGTLGVWLVRADLPALTMTSDFKSTKLHLVDMVANDANGGWAVSFTDYGSSSDLSPSEWFESLAEAPEIIVTTPDGDLTFLPSTGADADQLRAFLRACGGI
jgi:hypothetical protein